MIESEQRPSHEHSLHTLNALYEFDDFMMSVGTLLDLGCGHGLDLEWWATRTTRELGNKKPLNIRCTGVDLCPTPEPAKRLNNVNYLQQDFEEPLLVGDRKYDVAWCHNSFQYVLDPFKTLRNWREATADGGMLVLIVPQTTNLEFNYQAFDQPSGVYYNWTLVSLIHVLAVTGWDCRGGFFRKNPDDPWIHAVVYKSPTGPMDPRTTSWYDLVDAKMLPETADRGIMKYGHLRQRDLVLPWLDKSLMDYRRH